MQTEQAENNISEIKNQSYFLNRADRYRSPGDDDGEADFKSWADSLGRDVFYGHDGSQGELVFEDLLPEVPYLDSQAWTGGVEDDVFPDESESYSEADDYNRELGIVHACQHTSVILSTDEFDDYFHPLDCRRAWCPICGGKNGRVHKARKRAIRKRIDIEKNHLRYFVFTVPEKYRMIFKSRDGLNQLFKGVRGIVKKYLGQSKGAVASVHLYGDKDKGKFNPHINVLIPESLSVKLKISPEMLDEIKNSWRRSLIGMGCVGCEVVDVFYEFRLKQAHKGHVIKYVVRPTWDSETLDLVDDDEKIFLVLRLKGFQYLRFWGDLANCKYREGVMETLKEAIEECQELVGKRLHFRGVCNINVSEGLKSGFLIRVADGLYKRNKLKGEKTDGKAISED